MDAMHFDRWARSLAGGANATCANCRTDADCLELGMPPGSACVPVAEGHCAGYACEHGMACLEPCQPPVPEA